MSNLYNNIPLIKHSRSRQDLSHGVKTSGNVGTLYPFEVQEVYAGDTFKVKTSVVSRLSSQFIKPVMDNLFLDVYYFYVPSRLLYDKFVNIFGENNTSAWANEAEYQVPVVSGVVPSKSVGDYLGLPVGIPLEDINILPFRAFAKIYNEWFRDQNVVDPMHIQSGELVVSESFNSSEWSPRNYFGALPKVAKFHDYFTSAVPEPQKGNAPSLPIGSFENVPVVAGDASVFGSSVNAQYDTYGFNNTKGLSWVDSVSKIRPLDGYSLVKTGQSASLEDPDIVPDAGIVTPGNLWALTSSLSAQPVTVNDLRFAFQYQRMLERDINGSRYVEYLFNHFGVQAGDYRLQRSEFLGGRRVPISIHQVTQTTGAGNDDSPLADVGAFSLTNSKSRFTKGFVENGYVIGVFCIRQFHTYQQGVEKFWKRKKRVDFYDPVFSSIGYQPIMATELKGDAPSEQVFGYQEAWDDLRTRPARISGQMRHDAVNSLDVWHFADYYANTPTLSPGFIQETADYVAKAIVGDSAVQDQFILDFYINNIAYRRLPVFSVPGSIDHH